MVDLGMKRKIFYLIELLSGYVKNSPVSPWIIEVFFSYNFDKKSEV